MRINCHAAGTRGFRSWAFYSRLLQETKDSRCTRSRDHKHDTNGRRGHQRFAIPGRAATPGNQPSTEWSICQSRLSQHTWPFLCAGAILTSATLQTTSCDNHQREMARRYWPGEDPIGKTVSVSSFWRAPRTIIGVAEMFAVPAWMPSRTDDLHFHSLCDFEPNEFGLSAHARSQRVKLRQYVASCARLTRMFRFTTSRQLSNYSTTRSVRVVSICFCWQLSPVLLLVLASVGLFRVMAYLVSQRTHR